MPGEQDRRTKSPNHRSALSTHLKERFSQTIRAGMLTFSLELCARLIRVATNATTTSISRISEETARVSMCHKRHGEGCNEAQAQSRRRLRNINMDAWPDP